MPLRLDQQVLVAVDHDVQFMHLVLLVHLHADVGQIPGGEANSIRGKGFHCGPVLEPPHTAVRKQDLVHGFGRPFPDALPAEVMPLIINLPALQDQFPDIGIDVFMFVDSPVKDGPVEFPAEVFRG